MMHAITIDASGRLVLPKVLREQLHLRGAGKLNAEVVGGRLELTPVAEDNAELVEVDGLWVIRAKPGSQPGPGLSVVEAIHADREERIDTISRRVQGRP